MTGKHRAEDDPRLGVERQFNWSKVWRLREEYAYNRACELHRREIYRRLYGRDDLMKNRVKYYQEYKATHHGGVWCRGEIVGIDVCASCYEVISALIMWIPKKS